MNEAIVKNWNSVVNMDDDVYVLGDIVMSDTSSGIAALKQLKGKIHIIKGNHDTDNKIMLYQDCHNVVEICDAKWLKYNKQSFFLSHYPCLTDNHDEESQKPLNRRIINLCGHCHTKDKWLDYNKGLIYHCELDAHNNFPVLIDTILEEIKEKEKNK